MIACNTASAYALACGGPEVDVPIIGVVRPGAYTAASTTTTGKIGVIGTEGTINSGIYTSVLHEYDPDFTVVGRACPLFVPLVEEGLLNDPGDGRDRRKIFKSIKRGPCGHSDSWLYPLSADSQHDPADHGRGC